MMGTPSKAESLLRQAIELHERHMDGRAPVTGPEGDRSQMRMMMLMKDALAALTGRPEPRGMLSMD
ncbi:MAG TPA: hypothetical protein DDZ22_06935 [Massilia sp.]|nr:hypothetical protein [Massilia sp.]